MQLNEGTAQAAARSAERLLAHVGLASCRLGQAKPLRKKLEGKKEGSTSDMLRVTWPAEYAML